MKCSKTLPLISIVISLSVLVLVAIFFAGCSNSNCNYSIIITILTFLVTILIGWQIYQGIGLEKRFEKIDIEQKRTIGFLQLSMSWNFFFNLKDIDSAIKATEIAKENFVKIMDKKQIRFCIKQLENLKNEKNKNQQNGN